MANRGVNQGEAGAKKMGGARLLLGVAGGVLLLIGALVLYRWLGPPLQPTESQGTTPEVEKPKVTPVAAVGNSQGYVGIETCAECHAERAKDVKKTRHY